MTYTNVLAWLLLGCTASVFTQRFDVSDYNYVIEVLLVVDQPMYDSWMSENEVNSQARIIDEINGLFYEANLIYKSLEVYGIYMEIRLAEIVFTSDTIVTESLLNDRNGLGVTTSEALTDFVYWLIGNRYRGYDHAMFLSHIDLTDEYGDSGVLGVALFELICDTYGISVFEGAFTYENAVVIAHELGHSIGIEHDPTRGSDCSNEYLMNPYATVGGENRWYFSDCSAEYLYNFLESLGDGACLTETSADPITSPRMGTMLTADQFCQREWGKMVDPDYDSGNAVCNVLRCWDGMWQTKEMTSVEGLDCGSGKQCFFARCQ